MKIYNLYIDDAGSLTSHAHSYGLFSSMEKVGDFLKPLDWHKSWMPTYVEVCPLDPTEMQDRNDREYINL